MIFDGMFQKAVDQNEQKEITLRFAYIWGIEGD